MFRAYITPIQAQAPDPIQRREILGSRISLPEQKREEPSGPPTPPLSPKKKKSSPDELISAVVEAAETKTIEPTSIPGPIEPAQVTEDKVEEVMKVFERRKSTVMEEKGGMGMEVNELTREDVRELSKAAVDLFGNVQLPPLEKFNFLTSRWRFFGGDPLMSTFNHMTHQMRTSYDAVTTTKYVKEMIDTWKEIKKKQSAAPVPMEDLFRIIVDGTRRNEDLARSMNVGLGKDQSEDVIMKVILEEFGDKDYLVYRGIADRNLESVKQRDLKIEKKRAWIKTGVIGSALAATAVVGTAIWAVTPSSSISTKVSLPQTQTHIPSDLQYLSFSSTPKDPIYQGTLQRSGLFYNVKSDNATQLINSIHMADQMFKLDPRAARKIATEYMNSQRYDPSVWTEITVATKQIGAGLSFALTGSPLQAPVAAGVSQVQSLEKVVGDWVPHLLKLTKSITGYVDKGALMHWYLTVGQNVQMFIDEIIFRETFPFLNQGYYGTAMTRLSAIGPGSRSQAGELARKMTKSQDLYAKQLGEGVMSYERRYGPLGSVSDPEMRKRLVNHIYQSKLLHFRNTETNNVMHFWSTFPRQEKYQKEYVKVVGHQTFYPEGALDLAARVQEANIGADYTSEFSRLEKMLRTEQGIRDLYNSARINFNNNPKLLERFSESYLDYAQTGDSLSFMRECNDMMRMVEAALELNTLVETSKWQYSLTGDQLDAAYIGPGELQLL